MPVINKEKVSLHNVYSIYEDAQEGNPISWPTMIKEFRGTPVITLWQTQDIKYPILVYTERFIYYRK